MTATVPVAWSAESWLGSAVSVLIPACREAGIRV